MFKRITLVTMLFLLLGVSPVMAGDILIKVNGTFLNPDVPPIIQNDRTMVPFRFIFEALNASVTWDPNTKTVIGTKAGTNITLKIGNTIANVNGHEKRLDSPPIIYSDRTLVPVRFIAENLETPVGWDAENRIVVIGTEKLYNPDGSLLYDGMIINGQLSGQGKLYQNNKVIYKGSFSDGQFNGEGELFTPGGELAHKGEFKDGSPVNSDTATPVANPPPNIDLRVPNPTPPASVSLPDEIEEIKSPDGITYKGETNNQILNGLGKLYDAQGRLMYEGEFQINKLHGRGNLYKEGQFILTGQFVDGNIAAVITTGEYPTKLYYNTGELVYYGHLKDGKLEGKGVLYAKDGNKLYEGEFKNGEITGNGTYY